MPAPWQALTSRGVSPTRDRRAGSSGAPATVAAALERLLGQLGAVAGVGAVAAEGEEAVEVAAGELDVGGGFDVAGDDAEQHALLGQPRQQLLDPRHHPVAARLVDRVVEVAEVGGDRLGPLGLAAVAADHLAEDDRGDFRVGHAGVGVLLDVGVDPVQLAEGALPGDRAGPAGDEQGAVDVEEDRLDHRANLAAAAARRVARRAMQRAFAAARPLRGGGGPGDVLPVAGEATCRRGRR